MNDELILVNLQDEEIGSMRKENAHRLPALHRAFSVFLYKIANGGFWMLLQKRAQGKYHSGGLWTNACCSHPRIGESLAEAAPRRMMEELGIRTAVREIFSFPYYYRFSPTCAEFEYDHVLVGEWEQELTPNKEEIEEISWVEFPKLERQMMEKPDLFTPWFMIAAPRVMAWIRGEKAR